MFRTLLLSATLALAGCVQISTGREIAAKPAMPPDPASEIECVAAGGKWGPVGLMGTPACTMKSPTAGKACSDSDDCAGQCWTDAAPGTKTTGMCQPTNMPFGCHSVVKGGVAQSALCAD